MIKYFFLAVIVLISICPAFAQESVAVDSSNLAVKEGKFIGKIEVANIINPIDPAVLLALEYKLNDRLSISQEVGVITGYRGDQDILDEFIGFKVREELRFYFPESQTLNALPYVSLSGMYRYMSLSETGNIGYGCTSQSVWSCDYIQEIDSPVNSHQFGGALKVGALINVLPRITLEGDVGLSFTHLNFKRQDGADITYFFSENLFNNQERGYSIIPILSVKIGYRL